MSLDRAQRVPVLTLVFALTICVQLTFAQRRRQRNLSPRERQFVELRTRFEKRTSEINKEHRRDDVPGDSEAEKTARAQLVREFAPHFFELGIANPKDSAGLEALGWVATRAPFDESYYKALDLLTEHHVDAPGMELVCRRLLNSRSERHVRFLNAVAAKSTLPRVRGTALTALAIGTKRQAEAEGDRDLVRKAEKLFEEALDSFRGGKPAVKASLGSVAGIARREQQKLLGPLGIGKVAPDIEGVDLAGEKFKLSDYDGQYVAVLFWSDWCLPCRYRYKQINSLSQSRTSPAFEIVGVNLDEDREKILRVAKDEKIAWRSFWDGRGGPIAKTWGVHLLPTAYILDRDRRVRFRLALTSIDLLEDKIKSLTKGGK